MRVSSATLRERIERDSQIGQIRATNMERNPYAKLPPSGAHEATTKLTGMVSYIPEQRHESASVPPLPHSGHGCGGSRVGVCPVDHGFGRRTGQKCCCPSDETIHH